MFLVMDTCVCYGRELFRSPFKRELAIRAISWQSQAPVISSSPAQITPGHGAWWEHWSPFISFQWHKFEISSSWISRSGHPGWGFSQSSAAVWASCPSLPPLLSPCTGFSCAFQSASPPCLLLLPGSIPPVSTKISHGPNSFLVSLSWRS